MKPTVCQHSPEIPLPFAMPLVSMVVHPRGLHPIMQVKAYHLHVEEGMSLDDVRGEVRNLQGNNPGKTCVHTAVKRVAETLEKPTGSLLPETKYKNCGRHKTLGEKQKLAVVGYVERWRGKRFCTCRFIKKELKLDASRQTITRCLNEFGYFWRPVPKKQRLDEKHLKARKEFHDKYGGKSADWWVSNMNVVLDGVTLTMVPAGLSKREKHAAQRIQHMWVKKGEALENDLHTYNRYGTQLGTKVPLWGGFTGGGAFSLRLWTEKPKMNKEAWAKLIPKVKEAADEGPGGATPKVWHDNERFLLQPDVYTEHGLELVRFPPNSGDLNPIETVWAWLRKDLALREQADLKAKKPALTVGQFRARAAQILNSYAGQKRLEKLARGMPRRLQRLKRNKWGRCGK